MKPALTLLAVALVIGLEAALWAINPMHIPSSFLPARACGLQLFREPGPAMEPTVPTDQRVLVVSWPYWRQPPRVGDIVAFAYFVMGDNRDVSEDSRNYGFIARDRIIGRRWF